LKLGYKDDCSPVLRISASEVKCVLNVYPKEWMITEIDKDDLLKWDFENLKFIEPPWKLILSNKAILPLLWEMFPNHPNLVPAYYDSPAK
jgi:glutathionylspermidine synthase